MSSNKPFPSSDLDVFKDNSIILDNFVNSQDNEYPDRFNRKRPTITGIIKEAFSVRTDISNMNETLIGQSRWDVVPKNTSLTLGGDNGALNKQAQALFNRTEMLKVHAREALRRTYLEVGLNLVEGSFETGAVITSTTDVVLHEKTGKCYSGPVGEVPKGTNPLSSDFVERYKTTFNSVQSMLSSGIKFILGEIISTGLTKWRVTNTSNGLGVNGVYLHPVEGHMYFADCGVIHDSVTDNKVALDYASSLNIPVRFSNGFVGTSGTHIFNKGISGPGSEKCGFINLDTSASKTYLVTVQNTDQPLHGFSVDGSASTTAGTRNIDPISWASNNYDVWFGTRGLLVKNCPGIIISDIVGKNSARFSCIRLERSDNAILTFCHAIRSRGNFGDGFYHEGCVGVKYNFCTSWDTTRIGFVSEGNAGTSKISDNISYIGCTAGYSHDGSVKYGGIEYACGFWAENTDNVDHLMCSANSMEHAGFIWAPTTPANVAALSRTARYSQCTVNGADFGFMATPLSESAKNEAVYSDCVTSEITSQSYLSRPGSNVKIHATYNTCRAGQKDNWANCIAFSPETGASGTHVTMNINECVTTWSDTSRLTDSSANTGDIGQYAAVGTAEINVRSLKNETTGTTYCRINQTTAVGYNFTFDNVLGIVNTKSGGEIKIKSSSISGDITGCLFKLDGLFVPPSKSLKMTNGEVYGTAKLVDSRLTITHELGKMPETSRILGELYVDVEKDVSGTDYAIRLQFEQLIKPTFIINGNFYNSGQTSNATQNFIWAVRPGTKILTKGIIKDNTVPNIYRIDTTPGNFAVGQQNATMH